MSIRYMEAASVDSLRTCFVALTLALLFTNCTAQSISKSFVPDASAYEGGQAAATTEADPDEVVKHKEDCVQTIEKLAMDMLSQEQRDLLQRTSLADNLPFVSTAKSATRLFTHLAGGTTAFDDARNALEANRIPAIEHKAKWCSTKIERAGKEAISNNSTEIDLTDAEKISKSDQANGEVLGNPVPGGRFAELTIGMSASQVLGNISLPDDKRLYQTGKARIPAYFGPDKYRFDCAYRGSGRLTFSSEAGLFYKDLYLISIVHDESEPGKLVRPSK